MLEQILAEEVLIAAVWYRLVSLEIVLDTPPPIGETAHHWARVSLSRIRDHTQTHKHSR